MRPGDLPAYLSLNHLLNCIISWSWYYFFFKFSPFLRNSTRVWRTHARTSAYRDASTYQIIGQQFFAILKLLATIAILRTLLASLSLFETITCCHCGDDLLTQHNIHCPNSIRPHSSAYDARDSWGTSVGRCQVSHGAIGKGGIGGKRREAEDGHFLSRPLSDQWKRTSFRLITLIPHPLATSVFFPCTSVLFSSTFQSCR